MRVLRPADLPFADSLRQAAGWNQTLADWTRLMRHDPEGCFLAEWKGQPAATATTTIYGPEVAWVGMVLVRSGLRRRGIATALLERCLSHLRGRGVGCVKLDATPEGRGLYQRLGFRVEWFLSRWACAGRFVKPARPILVARVPAIAAQGLARLDQWSFGAGRGRMLEMLVADACRVETVEGRDREIQGFGLLRNGSRADYLGPAAASTPCVGERVIRRLWESRRKPRVFWDIPEPNQPAVVLAARLGFTRQRELVRMRLGRAVREADPTRIWAIADPALG